MKIYKINLLINTVKYLKFKQIFYRVTTLLSVKHFKILINRLIQCKL